MPVIKTKIYFNSFLAEIDKRLKSNYIKTEIYTQKVRNARKKSNGKAAAELRVCHMEKKNLR